VVDDLAGNDRIDDLVDVGEAHAAVSDVIRFLDDRRADLAEVEAARCTRANAVRRASFLEAVLESLHELLATPRGAGTFGVPFFAAVRADEEIALPVRHWTAHGARW
jgi:hypothetical protein